MPTQPTAQILTDPGYLFRAPLGTAIPTHTVSGSKFTDAWPAGWVVIGPTLDGSEFGYQLNLQDVYVAEAFDPVLWAPTTRKGSMAFSLASVTLTNLSFAFNTGAPTVVSGTGATQLNKLSPPGPTAIIRCMLGWESLDSTVRVVMYQTINGAEIKIPLKRAPALAAIPCEFNFEVPAAGNMFDKWTAGASRA